jgi:hypothetical protein
VFCTKFHGLRHDGALAWILQNRGPRPIKPPVRCGERPEDTFNLAAYRRRPHDDPR